ILLDVQGAATMIAAQASLLAASDASWVWNTLGLLSIPLLVALNGLFVAAEFALVAVRKTRVEELVQRGQQGARAVEDARPASVRGGGAAPHLFCRVTIPCSLPRSGATRFSPGALAHR